MKEDVKDLWVAALRGGDYQQGKGYLRRGDAFCCLGVLCDILGVRGVKCVPSDRECDGDVYEFGEEGITGGLPEAAKTLSGIASSNGSYGGATCLADDNDRDVTFPQIAEIIETNWRRLSPRKDAS